MSFIYFRKSIKCGVFADKSSRIDDLQEKIPSSASFPIFAFDDGKNV